MGMFRMAHNQLFKNLLNKNKYNKINKYLKEINWKKLSKMFVYNGTSPTIEINKK